MTASEEAARRAPGGSTSGSPRRWPSSRPTRRARWVLKPGDKWHGFEGLAENHVLVDPIKVTILTPGLVGRRQHAETRHSRRRRGEVPVSPAHRDREDRPLLLPRAVLDGHHQGQMEHARHRAAQLQGSVRRQRAAQRVLPALRGERASEAYAKMGLKDLCEQMHQVYREDNLPKAQKDMYTTLPEMAMRPADAYELPRARSAWRAWRSTSSWAARLAVMVVPYPPGIPVIMPGERLTRATKSIHDYLLYARDFDQKFPGFETDIHGLRFEPARRRQALPGGLRRAGSWTDDPALE